MHGLNVFTLISEKKEKGAVSHKCADFIHSADSFPGESLARVFTCRHVALEQGVALPDDTCRG